MPIAFGERQNPTWDALRVQTLLGAPTSDQLSGASAINGLGNKIILFHSNGADLELFDPTGAGLNLAIAAAASGDTVWLPSMSITLSGTLTIPANIDLVGIGYNSIIVGTVINNGRAMNLEIQGNVTNNNTIAGAHLSATSGVVVTMTTAGSSFIYRSEITASSTVTYAIDFQGGVMNGVITNYLSGTPTGIKINVPSDQSTISNCVFQGVTGCEWVTGPSVVMSNCQFGGTQAGHGFWFKGTGAGYVANSRFANINPSTGYGLKVDGTGLTLVDCAWTSVSGLASVTYGTGDRGAYSVEDYHATDIEAAALTRHLPAPTGSAADAGKYPFLNGAGTAWILSSSAAAGGPPGSAVDGYGDSIMAGTGASDAAHRFLNIVAAARGWTVNNTAVGGQRMIDMADQVYVATIAQASQSMLLVGFNDVWDGGTDAGHKTTFQDALYVEAAWLAIPDAKKIKATNVTAITYAGTWATNGAVYGGSLQRYSTASGSTATVTLYGRVIYIGATRTVAANATLSVTVDGAAQGTWSCTGLSASGSGRAYGPFLIRLTGFNEGPHTVVITYASGSGNIYLDWMAGVDGVPDVDGPNVWIGNCIRMSNYAPGAGTDAVVTAYNDLIATVATTLAGDGPQTTDVLASEYYNPNDAAQLSIDAIHPNDTGHANIAIAFLHAMDLRVHAGDSGAGISIAAGTGITLTPDPIVAVGTVTLANTAVAPATYGDASNVPQITVDQQGRITSAANVAISIFTPINVYNETIAADGISTIYYLTNYAAPSTIRVYIDGIRQPATDDAAPTDVVSFGVAPDAGAVLLFDYEMDMP